MFDVCSTAIPTCECSICGFRNPAHRTSLSSFPFIYHREISTNQAVRDVSASYDALSDLFESIGSFLSRLNIYTKVTLTAAMTNVIVKIMVEILSTLALATKQVKQGRLSKSLLTDAMFLLNESQKNL
jgi:hypothetical protein